MPVQEVGSNGPNRNTLSCLIVYAVVNLPLLMKFLHIRSQQADLFCL